MQKFVADENKTRHLPRLASYWLRPWTSPIVPPPKGTVLWQKRASFEPFDHKNRCNGSIWVRDEKGQHDNIKVTKVLYFAYLGEAPTGPIRPKRYMMGDVHDIMTCAKFQIGTFMGYDFCRVSNFRIFAWALQQCSQARIKVGVGPRHCTTVGPSVSHLSPSTHC